MLYYPKTSREGIAHFISYLDPLLKEGSTQQEVYNIVKAEISKVYLIYTEHMRILTYIYLLNPFRFSFLHTIKQLIQ
jgi:hypothetical protein